MFFNCLPQLDSNDDDFWKTTFIREYRTRKGTTWSPESDYSTIDLTKTSEMKLLMLGSPGTGKTANVVRWFRDEYEDNYGTLHYIYFLISKNTILTILGEC